MLWIIVRHIPFSNSEKSSTYAYMQSGVSVKLGLLRDCKSPPLLRISPVWIKDFKIVSLTFATLDLGSQTPLENGHIPWFRPSPRVQTLRVQRNNCMIEERLSFTWHLGLHAADRAMVFFPRFGSALVWLTLGDCLHFLIPKAAHIVIYSIESFSRTAFFS